jgi:hypothetical protein
MIAVKILIVLFILGWSALGTGVIWNFQKLFGPSPDDPSETPGARSFNLPTLLGVWVGGYGLALYFLLR